MSVGKVKNISGADIDLPTGNTFPDNTEIELPVYPEPTIWFNNIAFLQAAITAGDIEVRDDQDNVVSSANIEAWINSWAFPLATSINSGGPTMLVAALDGTIAGPDGTITDLEFGHIGASQAGFYLPVAGVLRWMSLSVQFADVFCDYDLLLRSDPTGTPSTVHSINLATSNRIVSATGLNVALPAGEYGISLQKNCASNPDYATTALALGPEAYYRFGEASGTTAVDETTNHDGTYIGGPTLGAEGRIPNDDAADFDGSSERMEAGTWNVDNTGLSLVIWINADSVPEESHDKIIYKGSSGGTRRWSLEWVGDDDDDDPAQIKFYMRANGVQDSIATSRVYGTGSWYFIVATFDEADGAMKLYVNNILAASGTHSEGASSVDQSSEQIQFGALGTSNEFDGTFDEGMIFDFAIDAADVQSLWDLRDTSGGPPDSAFDKALASVGVLLNG